MGIFDKVSYNLVYRKDNALLPIKNRKGKYPPNKMYEGL